MFAFVDDAIRACRRLATEGAFAAAARTGAQDEARVDVLGYAVTSTTPDACAESVLRWIDSGTRCRWVACMNPHSYVVARGDPRFREALRSADALLPDGVGIVLASRLLGRTVTRRVTGSDLFHAVMEAVDRRGSTRVFFLGASDETLAIIRDKVRAEFPGVILAGSHAPPFKPEFSAAERAAMIAAINAAAPDVLWVGMTAPKQELWLHDNLDRLEVKVAGAIGAAFDFYAGRAKRSSAVFQHLGLEWLPRLVREPRRLWKRTFVSAPIFLWDTAHAMLAERGSYRERLRSWTAWTSRGRASAGAQPGSEPELDVGVQPVQWPERASMTKSEHQPLSQRQPLGAEQASPALEHAEGLVPPEPAALVPLARAGVARGDVTRDPRAPRS
jgi:N-acetylglucosaminyldiphosphoundecaprenol N-acetyl-beta-D-mannosaminyltransferase